MFSYFYRHTTRPHFAATPVNRPEKVVFPNTGIVLRELNISELASAADLELVKSYQKAAVQGVENYLDSKIIPQTYDLSFDRFPAGRQPLYLEIGPVSTVESISYLDPERQVVEISPTDYKVDLASLTPRIQPIETWPITVYEIGAVTVRVIVGFAEILDTGTDPEKLSDRLAAIHQAIILTIRTWWTMRGLGTAGDLGLQSESIGDYSYTRANASVNDPENVGIPVQAQWLLNPYRRIAT